MAGCGRRVPAGAAGASHRRHACSAIDAKAGEKGLSLQAAAERPPPGKRHQQRTLHGIQNKYIAVLMLGVQMFGMVFSLYGLGKAGHECKMPGKGMIHEYLIPCLAGYCLNHAASIPVSAGKSKRNAPGRIAREKASAVAR